LSLVLWLTKVFLWVTVRGDGDEKREFKEVERGQSSEG
jgi:hypothetical protein